MKVIHTSNGSACETDSNIEPLMCCDVAKEPGRLPRLREERQAARQGSERDVSTGSIGSRQ